MDSQASQAAAIEAYVAIVKGIYRSVFIGYMLATSLYGITILQTYLYFRHFSKDPWTIKATVILLSALDTISTGLVTASLYTFLVDNFGIPDVFELDIIPLTFATENGIMTAIIWVVQLFYAIQIWVVSRSKVIPIVIVFITLAPFVLGIRDTLIIFRYPDLVTLTAKRYNIIRGVIKGINVIADLIITASLVTFFRANRTSLKRTGNILDKLIVYAGSRGALLTFCQILYLILSAPFPTHVYWQPAHQMISKVYVNSVLASLNARKAFEKVQPTDASLSNFNTATSLSLRTMRAEGVTSRVVITKEVIEDIDGKATRLVESR
ncbi:hypothetical protein HYPSUDRAFT_33351 [Hypholoma sublateritium FD-334 SS-4]|uniref:DUF6534 domain-containing protein n=1 Tax=Hypholoma sublateritium (strain FD-334 SS-4) TaxID=945553 RepID=A0A0D2PKI5_HYPSF|nr:hypothetical protein HYPSUDRAFT_33351 [Hypholoma sublateritium FD-334 SS-4]